MRYPNAILWSALLLAILLAACGGGAAPGDEPKDDPSPLVDPIKDQLDPTFILLSDVHLDSEKQKIISQSGGYCRGKEFSDTGTDLWEQAQTALKKALSNDSPNKPKFILCTGDFPAHIEPINEPHNIPDDESQVFSAIREIARDNCTPFVYAPGNNDGLGGDYHSFEDSDGKLPYATDGEYADQWPNIVPYDTFCRNTPSTILNDAYRSMGYYSVYPLGTRAKFRVIALNTVIFTVKDYVADAGPDQLTAAQEELDWMKSQLKAACDNQESVYLIMHIPPGSDYKNGPNWTTDPIDGKTINQHFLDIVQAHPCISGIFYGHTHLDEIKLLFDSTGNYQQLAMSCPGITPQHCNNPGFKIVSYDPNKGYAPTGFKTLYSDFFSTESAQPFDQSYTFKDYYGDPKGRTLKEHIGELYQQDQAKIAAGMAQTYYVRQDTGLSEDETKAIYCRY